MEENVIKFRTPEQVVLYECELSGQISDGNWENSRPVNHWEVMCEAKVEVGERAGLNFRPMRSYNFATKDLECVHARMLYWVRLYKKHPEFFDIKNDHWTYDLSDGCSFIIDSAAQGDKYWVDKLAKIMQFFNITSPSELYKVKEEIDHVDYDISDLRKDLREMSQVVNSARK